MPITYQYLTDRTLVVQSAITTDTLIHVVIPSDVSQNPAGSSYKAKLSQILPGISGLTFTGNTLSTCISDIYVSNLHSCSPLLVNPNNEGNVYFGSTSGITLDLTNKRIGINNNNPQYSLDVSGTTNITGALTSNTISATTYYNLPNTSLGNYLPLSGGTVTGGTKFLSGLTASTLNVTGLTQTKGITSTGGIIFKQITVSSTYSATTEDFMIDVSGGTFSVYLPSAIGIQGRIINVKNNGGGAVTVQPILSQTIDDKLFVILGETNALQLVSNGYNWVALGYNISTVNTSTGVFEFSGLSKVSSTQFSVAPVRAWITDDTSNPLSPQIYYVDYSGGTHTDSYVTTAFETFVYLTSGGTIGQQSTPLTEQQRRQNIFLGKIGHPEKTSINLVFSQPDFVLSPLAQLRDIFAPINLINGGVYPSANGSNLKFNTSAGYVYGLGINFSSNSLSPNAVSISGTSPCTFQYRTQTGGTVTNVTDIDPLNYDVGGVKTLITGTKATNQRIYLLQNGTFRVQYGQTEYNTLTQAIEALQTETFTPFPNFINNAVLIGILTVLSTATDLTDTTKAKFFFASKFGETVGAAGGIATTTLQQAYNNSSEPEIIINSTLDGVSIKNGTGNADNVTSLIQGLNSSGNVTSFIRADGAISATTISATTIGATGNCVTDLYISNIHSCSPLNIQPNNEGSVNFGSNSGMTLDVTNKRIGINTSTPQYTLDIKGTQSNLYYDPTSVGGNFVISGSTGIPRLGMTIPAYLTKPTAGLNVGMRAWDDATWTGYGKVGDAFFYAGNETYGFNILNPPGTATEDYIRFYAGQTATSTSDIHIQGSGSTRGYVGLGTETPTQKLHVSGNTLISGSLTANTFSGSSDTISGTKGTIITSGSSTTALLTFSGSGTVGGTGYTDFIRVTNTAVGATSPSKTFRTDIFGSFEIINNAYNSTLLSLTDAGNLTVTGRVKSNINYSQVGGGASVTLPASGSPQTILSTTITTYGNPVRISAYGDAENTGAGYWSKLQFWRDSTQLGAIVHTEGSNASENSPFGMSYIDNPAAGTYTYYLKANEISGGSIKFGESTAPTLNVQEL